MAGTAHEVRRQAFRLEVNAEIVVRLPDLGRDVKLILVDISDSGARLRSSIKLNPHTKVSFNWMGPSREPIAMHGAIVAIRMADPRTAEYGVQFSLSTAVRDRLAHELAEIQRRKAFKGGEVAAPVVDEAELGGRAKRKGYRAAVQFAVQARVPSKDGRMIPVRGEAQDLSSGGMLLAIPGDFPEGTAIELTFTLPVGAVDMGGEEKEVVEETPFGKRVVKKLNPVRPFDQLNVKARIVKKTGGARNGVPMWGVGFDDLSPFYQEEVARFVHAHQLTQLRKAAATQG